MFKISVLALIFGFVLLGNACLGFAQTNVSQNIWPNEFRDEVKSTNWEIRMHLAEKLSLDHTRGTFRVLLSLLSDENEDVSYAAAESIQARKDKVFADDFIATIKIMPKSAVWPAYRAAQSFPTPVMLNFLLQQLLQEIQFQHQRANFDNQNCFYLAQSLGQIAKNLEIKLNVSAPDGDDLSSYESFANELKSVKFKNGKGVAF
jgi:hypothetical protein